MGFRGDTGLADLRVIPSGRFPLNLRYTIQNTWLKQARRIFLEKWLYQLYLAREIYTTSGDYARCAAMHY